MRIIFISSQTACKDCLILKCEFPTRYVVNYGHKTYKIVAWICKQTLLFVYVHVELENLRISSESHHYIELCQLFLPFKVFSRLKAFYYNDNLHLHTVLACASSFHHFVHAG